MGHQSNDLRHISASDIANSGIFALFYVSQVSRYRRSNKEIDDLTQQLDEAIEAACGGPVDDGDDVDQIQEILDSYLR